jgi:hypothetical protein
VLRFFHVGGQGLEAGVALLTPHALEDVLVALGAAV